MLAEMSSPFFHFDWIRTTWFNDSAAKAKERKRLLELKEQHKQEQNVEENSQSLSHDEEKEQINS
jgi:hypothetical protein